MERIFQISAVILAGIAAFFLWSGYNDAGFAAAVLGAVSFFLSIRFQVKERLEQRKAEDEEARETALISNEFDSDDFIDDRQTTAANDEQNANL
jgi:hypothetical protein